MSSFFYQAIKHDGTEISGKLDASDHDELVQLLRRKHLVLVSATVEKKPRLKKQVISLLIAELSDLIASKIPVERSLQIISEDNPVAAVSELAAKLRVALKEGASLSQAFEQTVVTPKLVVPMLKAGEQTGQLGEALVSLNAHFQAAKEFRSELVGKLAYPAILFLVSIFSMIALAVFVIPVFKDIFDGNNAALPTSTAMIFAFSDFMLANGITMLVVLMVAVLAGILLYGHSAQAQEVMQRFMLKIPFIGKIIRLVEAERLTGILGILLNNGISLAESLAICKEITANRQQSQGVQTAIDQLTGGASIAEAMAKIPLLPPIGKRLLQLGNESGDLAAAADKAHFLIARDTRNLLRTMVSLIEPIIIVTMGFAVGFVVISMLLAVFDLSSINQ
ncbi:type II secretion system F family protein [Aliamphritea hakodatensis]|uniref:type II secretion system F family protein n=1 Tax=Aliamphritea hakodatensis TaxID=2895352 RepID=UPI0022FD62DA|nr:type II secretion system F family protein [Aliamphritea hakodatensis]